jgi:PST family polysaccharide transporter
VSALGFGSVGTRQIAEANANDDAQAVSAARRALFWGTMGLATLGGGVFWLLRETLATTVIGDADAAGTVGWLAVGVALTVAAGSQGALLNGLRRIGDVARVSVLSTLLSTLLGVGALVLLGDKGVLFFVLAGPLSSFLLGHWFVSRLPRMTGSPTQFRELQQQWETLARLGVAFMVAGLAGPVGQLAVRMIVQQELGAESLGNFQAAWMISAMYIGFVLGAMGADYYPRLTATISDSAATNQLVNEQAEVALLLAGPVLVTMLGLAPWVIELLFSSQFTDAADVLRWQVLGDVLKVASWPLGIVILASGDGRMVMLIEFIAMLVLIGLTWVLLPFFGIEATGIASMGKYAVFLPMVYVLARRRTGFRWQARVYRQLVLVMVITAMVFICGVWSKWLGAGLGVFMAAVLGLYALARIGQMTNLSGSAGRMAVKSRALMMKIGVWDE